MAIEGIDGITVLEKGRRIVAEKFVRPDEEYFRDHFTGFPVLPGVLMLEGLVQSASWLVRVMEDLRSSIVTLAECSQAKYSKLVRPGSVITFEAELLGSDASGYAFKGKVTEEGKTVALARFKLRSQPVSALAASFAHLDAPSPKNTAGCSRASRPRRPGNRRLQTRAFRCIMWASYEAGKFDGYELGV